MAAILSVAGAAILALGILAGAILYRTDRGPAEDTLLNELNTQGTSEDPEAVAEDIRKTTFEHLDREMPELEALLSP